MNMNNDLSPVEFNKIKVGGFWKQQFKRLTERWLPHCVRQMEPGGAGQELLNFINAGKSLRGEPYGALTGLPWSDAYIHNTVEAICLALAVDPDGDADLARVQGYLRAKLEEWIPIILAAQSPDGYIHTYHTLNGKERFSNIGSHEFYVMGYFLEMGIAHFKMTAGKDRRLYEAAVWAANHLDAVFGPPPKRTWKNGHAGLELALCRLARLVNEVEGGGAGDRYTQLARYFLDHQDSVDSDRHVYDQSDKPAVEMHEAAGHAVRATYFYTAMADMALAGDAGYRKAVDSLWDSAIQRKHYLTGAAGAAHPGEAFSADFDLPNNGYCEACASCGMSFWSERMHQLYHDAHYRDVQERALYNTVLGALDLAGEKSFYQNPPASNKVRDAWHGCPCCVGNIPRALIAIKDLMYATNAARDELYLTHFVDSEGVIANVAGGTLILRQETEYPWKGRVRVSLTPSTPVTFTLKIRIPNRTESRLYTAVPDLGGKFVVSVNGKPQSLTLENGFVVIRREWGAGDTVDLSLPMDIQRITCDERVAANRGRVALQRGPLVYSVEDVDHSGPAESLTLPPDAVLKPVWRPDLLGGVMAVQGGGVTAIPFFLRLNRGGYSQVWIKKKNAAVEL